MSRRGQSSSRSRTPTRPVYSAVHCELIVDPARPAQFNPPSFRQRIHRIRGGSWARFSIRVLSRFVERQQAVLLGWRFNPDSPNIVYGRLAIWTLRERLSYFVEAYVSSRGVDSLAACDAADDDPEFTYGITDLYIERQFNR